MRQQYRRSFSLVQIFPADLFRKNAPFVLFVLFALTSMFAVYRFYKAGSSEAAVSAANFSEEADLQHFTARTIPIFKEIKKLPVTQRRAQSPGPIRFGLIAGHRNFDSGTECADGLTEVQITNPITEDLAAELEKLGFDVETLDEFDPRLDNYSASGLVSIHIDSCDYINDLATGFKISGSPYTDSSDLSICVQQKYAEVTELPYHPNSITPHMANYHAFYKISQGTPAIIIEIGFLNLDRQILTEESDKVVEGLFQGIDCFVQQSRQ